MTALLIGLGVALLVIVALLSNTPAARARRAERQMQRVWGRAACPDPSLDGLRATVEYQERFVSEWHDQFITAAHHWLDRDNTDEALRCWLMAGETEESFWDMMEE